MCACPRDTPAGGGHVCVLNAAENRGFVCCHAALCVCVQHHVPAHRNWTKQKAGDVTEFTERVCVCV